MIRKSRGSVRAFKGIYLALVLAFLYLPILVMFGLSFNASVSRAEWTGFTLDWYAKLFQSQTIIDALKVTLSVAVIATIASVIIGTLGAIGMYSMKRGWFNLLSTVSNIPMTMPDIVTGVSLMLMFVFMKVPLGKGTMIMAHIAFDIPYVLFSVLPRLQMMNPNIYEAALDLGATPHQALWKVLIPQLRPGMITGFILAFTMSLDDFAVTYFTSGSSGLETLSTYIYADVRKGGLTPELKPMMTIIFLVILVVLLAVNIRASKKAKQ